MSARQVIIYLLVFWFFFFFFVFASFPLYFLKAQAHDSVIHVPQITANNVAPIKDCNCRWKKIEDERREWWEKYYDVDEYVKNRWDKVCMQIGYINAPRN